MTFKDHSRSLEMSRFDFLSPLHSNSGPLFYRFAHIAIGRKSRNLYRPTPCTCNQHLRRGWLSLNFQRRFVGKLEWWNWRKYVYVKPFRYSTAAWQRNGLTDRQTEFLYQYRASTDILGLGLFTKLVVLALANENIRGKAARIVHASTHDV